MVEKIYVNNIVMKDIVGEAILFDMYYMAKDPVPLAGENREAPKVEILPVTEATPQFRDFHVKNIVCYGAAKAIFIRGLPEMNIKNIELENLVIQARKGVECEEATNISIKNLQLVTVETNPLINILNSNNILFDTLLFDNAKVLVNVSGDRNSKIRFLQTDVSKAKVRITKTENISDSVIDLK